MTDNSDLVHINLDEAQRLIDAATKGPWRVGRISGTPQAVKHVRTIEAGPINSTETFNIAESGIDGERINTTPVHDFALIEYAVNNLPHVIEELRELRELKEQADDAALEARFNDR